MNKKPSRKLINAAIMSIASFLFSGKINAQETPTVQETPAEILEQFTKAEENSCKKPGHGGPNCLSGAPERGKKLFINAIKNGNFKFSIQGCTTNMTNTNIGFTFGNSKIRVEPVPGSNINIEQINKEISNLTNYFFLEECETKLKNKEPLDDGNIQNIIENSVIKALEELDYNTPLPQKEPNYDKTLPQKEPNYDKTLPQVTVIFDGTNVKVSLGKHEEAENYVEDINGKPIINKQGSVKTPQNNTWKDKAGKGTPDNSKVR